eukprot:s285_g5.t1
MTSVSEQAARTWLRNATPPTTCRITVRIPTGDFSAEKIMDDLLPFLPIPADTECDVNNHILPIKFPLSHPRPPPLQELASSWVPWDEPLNPTFQYALIITDLSMFRRCAFQVSDVPHQRVLTLSDAPYGPMASISMWLVWPPMTDLLYQVHSLDNRVQELERNLSREHHARGALERTVSILRSDIAILIETACAATPALADRFGHWR